MDSPTTSTARWMLLSACVVCAFGMLGPLRGLEKHIVPADKAAHVIAFYGLTLLSFSAFPGRRRIDVVTLAIFAGAAVEVFQGLTGHDAELGDLAADAAGAFAAFAPIYFDRLRQPHARRRAGDVAQPSAETERRTA